MERRGRPRPRVGPVDSGAGLQVPHDSDRGVAKSSRSQGSARGLTAFRLWPFLFHFRRRLPFHISNRAVIAKSIRLKLVTNSRCRHADRRERVGRSVFATAVGLMGSAALRCGAARIAREGQAVGRAIPSRAVGRAACRLGDIRQCPETGWSSGNLGIVRSCAGREVNCLNWEKSRTGREARALCMPQYVRHEVPYSIPFLDHGRRGVRGGVAQCRKAQGCKVTSRE